MIPYADIIENADRRLTARLLDRLVAPDLSADELSDLTEALQAVSNPHSVGPLEAIVYDVAQPVGIRKAASSILHGMQYFVPTVPEAKLLRWWCEGDPVLRSHALQSMDAFACPDIILAVASDPCHALQAEALDRMAFDFDLPEHEQVKIDALSHADSQVRETAASILLWDEPVGAEGPLLEAAHDLVPEVAAEACVTLKYYPSLKSIACLHALLDHPAERVRQEAEVSVREIRQEVVIALQSHYHHVRAWLRPVWGLLAVTDDELRPEESPNPPLVPQEPIEAVPPTSLLELLADSDASPKTLQETLWRADWRAVAPPERSRLRGVLLEHPDPLVREEAAVAFGAWEDADGLLALVRDPDFGVRKAAMYRLGQLPPRPGLADLAWKHLHRRDALGVHAVETLATFVQHGDRADVVRKLGSVAGDHGLREGLRTAAVYHLKDLGAAEEISQLTGLLLEPPVVAWGLHLGLLDAVAALGMSTPNLGHLPAVDHLHVQIAVAGLGV